MADLTDAGGLLEGEWRGGTVVLVCNVGKPRAVDITE